VTGTPNQRVKLATLREYTAQSGRRYFAGYMGLTKLLLFRDDAADIVGAEVGHWNLLIEPVTPQPSKAAPAARPPPPRPAPARAHGSKRQAEARARAALRERGIDPDARITDDAIGF
jgi:pyruvate/2-oxoglutarate dehydrogenase complex dihydrolipoamide acyltransferase (E2) component